MSFPNTELNSNVKGTAERFMKERKDLSLLYERLKLSKQLQAVIEDIRSAEPSRIVESGRSNVRGRYPSKKMGRTIQFESHKNELARIKELPVSYG